MNIVKKNIAHRLEFLLLRILQILLAVIPRPAALHFGCIFGLILYHLGIYRRIVGINMNHVALWPENEAAAVTRKLYCNLGKYAVDFLRPPYPLPRHRLHGYEAIEPLLNEGKGTIVILGHIGNWELLATVFGSKTGKLHVIAKPMHNPLVDRWLLAKRNESSVTTIYSSQALRKMISVLKNDGIIAILIDQFMRGHGDTIPFLGREAKTVSTVAGIALKTGCNVISVEAIMADDGSYDIRPLPTSAPEGLHELPEEERIRRLQTLHNDILSRQIIEHPEHWFGWFHRRFRDVVDYSKNHS